MVGEWYVRHVHKNFLYEKIPYLRHMVLIAWLRTCYLHGQTETPGEAEASIRYAHSKKRANETAEDREY